jgi:hypothetical protein
VLAISFARERQHRIRPGFNAAPDSAGEMDAQEREARIGYRVNQIAHQELAFGPDQVIFAAKRHDANRARLTRELGDAIRVQPGAGNQKIAGRFSGCVNSAPAARLAMKRRHAGAGDDFPALLSNQALQHLTHPRIIHDAFLRDVNRLDAARMRLDLQQLVAVEHAQAGQSVLASSLEQIVQARHFLRTGGDHHLAAHLVPDPVRPAEFDHLVDAANGQSSAARSRFVVQTAVQHAAVMAALMQCHGALLFEDGDANAGNPLL